MAKSVAIWASLLTFDLVSFFWGWSHGLPLPVAMLVLALWDATVVYGIRKFGRKHHCATCKCWVPSMIEEARTENASH